jgi:hypothetical protein
VAGAGDVGGWVGVGAVVRVVGGLGDVRVRGGRDGAGVSWFCYGALVGVCARRVGVDGAGVGVGAGNYGVVVVAGGEGVGG